MISVRDYSLSTYAEFSEKLAFLTPWYAHLRENFAYLLNEWSISLVLVNPKHAYFFGACWLLYVLR